MTCKQMGGTCDTLIQGNTAEEMMSKGSAHLKEMSDQGDEEHKKVLAAMEEMQKDPESVKKFNDDFMAKFNELPEE